MKPELIIIAVVGLLGFYILIQFSVTNRKIKSKSAPSKESAKEKQVELKTVIAPKPEAADLTKEYLLAEEEAMKKAALESIEYEKALKNKQLQEENAKFKGMSEEDIALNKKLEVMREKMSQINFNSEEKTFIDEVEELSPRLKAVLFAELLTKHGVDENE